MAKQLQVQILNVSLFLLQAFYEKAWPKTAWSSANLFTKGLIEDEPAPDDWLRSCCACASLYELLEGW